MPEINIAPAVLAAIAWSCSLNAVFAQRLKPGGGLDLEERVYSGAMRTGGLIGLLISSFLGLYAAGLWGLLIIPASGVLLSAIALLAMRDLIIAWSVQIALVSSFLSAILSSLAL